MDSTTGLGAAFSSVLSAANPAEAVSTTTSNSTPNHHNNNSLLLSPQQLSAALSAGMAMNPAFAPGAAPPALPALLDSGNLAALDDLSKLVAMPGHQAGHTPLINYLRGAVVQALSSQAGHHHQQQQHQLLPELQPAGLPANLPARPASSGNAAPVENVVLPVPEPEVVRRIRRRRPKSPKPDKPKKSKAADETEQQMNTPEDPVIHSPSSSRGPMFASNSAFLMSANDAQDNSEESRRRQKTCRVCGDHATGYNFNVITCESCKAFFRRNALRPKEFKCPYSDDCEINAVSRRFCQKCRLRKCFQVGMKKEWILNEEQLRRRKNSRLNSLKSPSQPGSPYLSGQQLLAQQSAARTRNQQVVENVINTVKSELPDQVHCADFRLSMPRYQLQQFLQSSPTSSSQQQQSPPQFLPGLAQRRQSDLTLSPVGGPASHSTISSLMSPQNVTSPESPALLPSSEQLAQSTSLSDIQHLVRSNFVNSDEYSRLLQAHQDLKPIMMRQAVPLGVDRPYPQAASLSPFKVRQPSGEGFAEPGPANAFAEEPGSAPGASSSVTSPAGSLSGFLPFFEMTPNSYRHMEETIQDALLNSPDEQHEHPSQIDFKDVCHTDVSSYQLNSSELCELDVVRNAYSCMDEPLINDTKALNYLKKRDHNPTDIMNIMDITMRRFVKMTKKLPAFNTLSQDSKLVLLKAAMVQLLTMRGVTRFDAKKLCWNTPVAGQAQISCDMFDKLNDRSQKSRFIRFCMKMDESVRKNDVVINLIGLVILFRNTNVITDDNDKHLSKKYHTLYSNLLRRYIESVHGFDASRILESIPDTLQELQDLSSHAETLFVGRVKMGETEQLPTEFFKTSSVGQQADRPEHLNVS